MDTILDKIKEFNAKGYTIDFNVKSNLEELLAHHQEYKIDEVYRYEGLTNPEDEAIVYAISSKDGQNKGVLVSGYGIYADDNVAKVVLKLKENKNI